MVGEVDGARVLGCSYGGRWEVGMGETGGIYIGLSVRGSETKGVVADLRWVWWFWGGCVMEVSQLAAKVVGG